MNTSRRVVAGLDCTLDSEPYANYTVVIHDVDMESEQVYTQINGYRTTPPILRTFQQLRMWARVGFAATEEFGA